MFQAGHYGMALLLYSIIAFPMCLLGYRRDAVYGALVVFAFTMHPDLDTAYASLLHREITHTIWFGFFVGCSCVLVLLADLRGRKQSLRNATVPCLWVFFLGTLSVVAHLLADALNPWGITPLHPVSEMWITFAVVRASHPSMNPGLLAAGLLAFASSLYLGSILGPEPTPVTADRVRAYYQLLREEPPTN